MVRLNLSLDDLRNCKETTMSVNAKKKIKCKKKGFFKNEKEKDIFCGKFPLLQKTLLFVENLLDQVIFFFCRKCPKLWKMSRTVEKVLDWRKVPWLLLDCGKVP